MKARWAARRKAAGARERRARLRLGSLFRPLPQARGREVYCSREDSNLHGFPHTVLSRTRLPVPPREQTALLQCSHGRWLQETKSVGSEIIRPAACARELPTGELCGPGQENATNRRSWKRQCRSPSTACP